MGSRALIVAGGWMLAVAACASGDYDERAMLGSPAGVAPPSQPSPSGDAPSQAKGQWEYRDGSTRYGFSPRVPDGGTVYVDGASGGTQMMTGSRGQGGWRSTISALEIMVVGAEGQCVSYRLLDPGAGDSDVRMGVTLVHAVTGLATDCPGAAGTCPAGHTRCDSGACVGSNAECDTPSSDCEMDEVACIDGSCIPEAEVCDGFAQCIASEDEQGCNGQPGAPPGSCGPAEASCGDGNCIAAANRCDGTAQCANGSDEQGCMEPPSSCGAMEGACADGTCIPANYQCDGVVDCAGGEDEEGTWTCDDGGAVACAGLCDDRTDCDDASDELLCF